MNISATSDLPVNSSGTIFCDNFQSEFCMLCPVQPIAPPFMPANCFLKGLKTCYLAYAYLHITRFLWLYILSMLDLYTLINFWCFTSELQSTLLECCSNNCFTIPECCFYIVTHSSADLRLYF